MRVWATVLSFDDPASTEAVVNAVQSQTRPPDGIVVVENGYASRLSESPGVHIRSSSQNRGVGWGHNEGVAAAIELGDPDWLWILEHDTLPDPNCLADLCEHLGDIPNTHALIPTLARHNGERDLARDMSAGRAAQASFRIGETYAFGMLTFNAMLISREAIERLGPFREDFFVGHEDYEFRDRMLQAGMLISHRVEPAGIHRSWGNTRHGIEPSPARRYYSVRNSLRLALDRGDHLAAGRIILRNVGGIMLGNYSRIRARATLDALTSRMGERSVR